MRSSVRMVLALGRREHELADELDLALQLFVVEDGSSFTRSTVGPVAAGVRVVHRSR